MLKQQITKARRKLNKAIYLRNRYLNKCRNATCSHAWSKVSHSLKNLKKLVKELALDLKALMLETHTLQITFMFRGQQYTSTSQTASVWSRFSVLKAHADSHNRLASNYRLISSQFI